MLYLNLLSMNAYLECAAFSVITFALHATQPRDIAELEGKRYEQYSSLEENHGRVLLRFIAFGLSK